MIAKAPVTTMTYLRSLGFYVVSVTLAIPFLLLFPIILLPAPVTHAVCALYLRLQAFGLRCFCGISYEVKGINNLPDGPVLIASQHESTWETLYFQHIMDRPVMYAKEPIFSYPVFGPIARKMGHIPVPQTKNTDAVRDGFKRGAETIASGRKLLIFPSGTRRVEGGTKLQAGVGALYQLSNVPVVPVLVNSGQCWPHNTWLKFPGTIKVEVLPAIPAGLPREDVMERLRLDLARDPGQPRGIE